MVTVRLRLRKIYGWVLCLLLILGAHMLPAQQVKTYYIPEDVKIEENAAKETVVQNLSDEELYLAGPIQIIDSFIYFQNRKPYEIVKLNLQGKAVLRNQNHGTGPGEYIVHAELRAYKDKIAVQDNRARKIIIFSKNLEFVREFKILDHYLDFFVNKKNEFVLFGSQSKGIYFSVRNDSGIFLRNFGKTITTKRENDKMLRFDSVRCVHYIPESAGIWTSFRHRYDLRYYEKEKFKLEIKGPSGYFKGKVEDYGGPKVMMYSDRGVYLAIVKDQLFFFYKKDGVLLCDIIGLRNYQLRRRLQFKVYYRYISHFKEGVFYAVGYADNEDQDLLLSKLEI